MKQEERRIKEIKEEWEWKVVGKPESLSDLQGFFLGDQDVWDTKKQINLKKQIKRTIGKRIRQLERAKRK